MQFESYKPSGMLRNFISSITYLHDGGTGAAFQHVYQTIIINLGANFLVSSLYEREAEAIENTSAIWINGKQDVPIMIENRGITKMYVLGVNGGMLPYLTNFSAHETNNKATPAEQWAPGTINSLRDKLLTSTIQEGFILIDTYFTELLSRRELTGMEKTIWFNTAIHTQSIESICQTLGVTRKKLREDAIYHYWASAKNLQGMIRFNNTLSTIAHHADKPLSAIDYFYDQSHFIKDFKARTGMIPLHLK